MQKKQNNNFNSIPEAQMGGWKPQEFSLNTDSLEWRLRFAQVQKEEDPIKATIQQSIQASCTVFVHSAEMQEWTGSGFHVGDGFIVTAAHVAPGDEHIEIAVSFNAQRMFPCQLIMSDTNMDVAILFCEHAKNVQPVQLGNSDSIEVGDIIATISSPEGWHDTATVGRISNIHQEMGEYAPSPAWNDVIFIDADILQGSSGGMVIGTDGLAYGSIMGVAGQHADIGIGQRAICPSNKIIKLLQTIKK